VLSALRDLDDRISRAREDSDVAYFFDLLIAGEMVLKLATAWLIACLEDDRERHRYRLEFDLVRADGLGTWSSALDDALTGPASQVLTDEGRGVRRELTQAFSTDGSEWQPKAVALLHEARAAVEDASPLPAKVAARRWFADFAELRNRTRAHGATLPSTCSGACEPLHRSIQLIIDNLALFRASWVHLHRNLSGKYRVTDLGNGTKPFDYLKASKDHSLANGIHAWAGAPRPVALLSADEGVRDFYLPNGGFNGRTYELLSYVTDTRLAAPADNYIDPPTSLPPSETQGTGELELMGNAFANLPPHIKGYVKRDDLEGELTALLMDDQHQVITLGGRGGIGKTSLALEVLHDIAESDRFFAIVWFSARDIELLPQGPKLVQPHVLSPDDMAREYIQLVKPAERAEKGFKPLDYFARAPQA
jgi:hypothetical protein